MIRVDNVERAFAIARALRRATFARRALGWRTYVERRRSYPVTRSSMPMFRAAPFYLRGVRKARVHRE